MFIIVTSLIFIYLVLSLCCYEFFIYETRISFLVKNLISLVNNILLPALSQKVFFIFFIILLVSNVLGNMPLSSVPSLFYSLTFTLSLVFWLSLIICVSWSNVEAFFSHLLPYGCPIGLILFLPLVEGFSLLIRPLTLIIRLRTNLAAGHIMLYIFSYFVFLRPIMPALLPFVIAIIFLLELFISALQAYIFFALLILYRAETL